MSKHRPNHPARPLDAAPSDTSPATPIREWWFDAFPSAPYATKQPGPRQMLYLVAYDIADPKRLVRIAKACEDFGVRVQYSLFECRLEPDEFQRLWQAIRAEMDSDEDRAVAYPLDARATRETLTAGTMVCTERVVCYLV